MSSITDTVRKSLEGIKSEVHVLLSTLPHTHEEIGTRLETISGHLLAAGANPLDLERAAKHWLETSDGKALLDKLVQEAVVARDACDNSAKVSGLAITGATTESHDTEFTADAATMGNLATVTDEQAVGLGTTDNLGYVGHE